jgi:hypothetical protein
MPLSEHDRQLGMALDSDQVQLVLDWLSETLAEGATLPPVDDNGRVDQGAALFRQGQHSVLNKIRGMRRVLKGSQ